MWSSCVLVVVVLASLLVLLHSVALVSADKDSTTSQWQTLKGKPPLVIARGGFSGLFPGSSSVAYDFTLSTSVPDVLLWCDVQLTKEGAGICFPDLLLSNSSDVDIIYPKTVKTYTIDYTLKDLANVSDCFAYLRQNASVQDKPFVISKNGASGDYPDCTDLAYMKALEDGVDVLDCPVQMSKDRIPFCSSSISLNDITTVAQSSFQNFTMVVPEFQAEGRIYTFSLTWDQIKTLQPSISNPPEYYKLYRNPRFRRAGTYMKLSDFLNMAKNRSSVSGVLISIEYAAYLAEKQGLSVTDAVITELNKAGLDNQTGLDIMIQSTNSSVLMKFKEKSKCKLVYKIEEVNRDALNTTLQDIKKFADAVVINKASVFPENVEYVTGATDVVTKLHAFDLHVYVELFSNEYLSQAWDFFSDPTVEINSFVSGVNVDGII